MANHASAKKRIRQTRLRSAVNRARLSNLRTHVKRVESAISAGDAEAAKVALAAAEPVLARGAQRGVIHRNTAIRKMSRLSARVKALQA